MTFYVGNLSFKATSDSLLKVFEKRLSIKVDSVVIARDSTRKSRGCAFVTVRWNDFHKQNAGYSRDADPKDEDKTWSDYVTSIMSYQPVAGRNIYVEVARCQRRVSQKQAVHT